MIVVTVGTHEQPFDRLILEVDRLGREGLLPDDVFCQIGYGMYEPVSLEFSRMVPFGDLSRMVDEASLVISHGGPGSIMPVLQAGRPLILVPRRHVFGEHVDDHQVAFCRRVAQRRGLACVEDITDLRPAIDAAFSAGAHAREAPGETPAGVHELRLLVDSVLRRGA